MKCPLCPKKFAWAIALGFHARKEHPDNLELVRPFITRMYEAEALRRKLAAVEESKKIPRSLLALYRDGCPCGRSYEDHLKTAAKFGREP